MKQKLALGITTLALIGLVGCGNDIAKTSRSSAPDKSQPAATAEESKLVLNPSFIHREKGSPVLTYTLEIAHLIANDLPVLYSPVPKMLIHDEGTDQVNVYSRDILNRPTTVCGAGAAFSTISARLSDCASKNKDRATWSGEIYGASGEGNWKLVALSGPNQEVWLDERTGMVWSDIQTNAGNWCQASGNEENVTAPGTVDCQTLRNNISFCVGLTLSGIGENIKWRLPTRNDFLAADLNGLRLALRKGESAGFWTATMVAKVAARNKAWVYYPANGTLSAEDLSTTRQVRCIGAIQ